MLSKSVQGMRGLVNDKALVIGGGFEQQLVQNAASWPRSTPRVQQGEHLISKADRQIADAHDGHLSHEQEHVSVH